MMKARLVAYTKPSDELASQGIKDVQEFVAFCARVSNPSNQYNTKTSEKLIRYLIDNAHWSPLEMADATIEIETTRDIGRQIIRHASFRFQEYSQRYSNPLDEKSGLNFVLREARLQDSKNRQNSIVVDDHNLQVAWNKKQQQVIDAAKDAYKWAIDNGIAKEQARAVLPEGNTITRMYMHGSIRSWIHYLQLRIANGTQKEHSDLALEIAKAIKEIFPMTDDLLFPKSEHRDVAVAKKTFFRLKLKNLLS